MDNLEKLKQEFISQASTNPDWYFDPQWTKMLEMYMDMAFAIGYEWGCKGRPPDNSKSVLFFKAGEIKYEFKSAKEAGNFFNIYPSAVTQAIQKHHKCRGYRVEYKGTMCDFNINLK